MKPERLVIHPYLWSIVVDLGKFVNIDLGELVGAIRALSIKKAHAIFEPERAPHVRIRMSPHGLAELCNILVWEGGKFIVTAADLTSVDVGIDFMLDYVEKNEQWHFGSARLNARAL